MLWFADRSHGSPPTGKDNKLPALDMNSALVAALRRRRGHSEEASTDYRLEGSILLS